MSNPNPDFDQLLSQLRDSMPGVWWALYTGCIEKGFSEKQALKLVQTYIKATSKTG